MDLYEQWEPVARGDKSALPGVDKDVVVLGWERDPIIRPSRDERRLVIRCEVEPAICDVAGYVLYQGTNLLLIYESDLPAFERQVATAEERSLRANGERLFRVALETEAKALGWREGAHDADAIMAKAKMIIGKSVESIVSDMENATSDKSIACSRWTGWSRLRSLDVLGSAPQPATARSQAAYQMDAITEAFTRAMGGGAGADMLARMQARLDELEARLAAADGKRRQKE